MNMISSTDAGGECGPETTTVGLTGGLPNRVFTLVPSAICGILNAADLDTAARRDVAFLCKKFFLVTREYERNKAVHEDMGTIVTLNDGRITAEGNNHQQRCGVNTPAVWLPTPRWVRLPPVLQLWSGYGSWYAKTTRGLYAWGHNVAGKLGAGTMSPCVPAPAFVGDIDPATITVTAAQSFFCTNNRGWLVCGKNYSGELGLGHTDEVTIPTPASCPSAARWYSNLGSTFIWTKSGLMACGVNNAGQLGIGSGQWNVTTPTPVDLPAGFRTNVDQVVCKGNMTMIVAGRTGYICGLDHFIVGKRTLATPMPLPFPIDDAVTHGKNALFLSNGQVLSSGNNASQQITASPHCLVVPTPAPLPLDLPGPARCVSAGDHAFFVQINDGSWWARGKNQSGSLGVGQADASVGGWTRVALDGVSSVCTNDANDTLFITDDGVFTTSDIGGAADQFAVTDDGAASWGDARRVGGGTGMRRVVRQMDCIVPLPTIAMTR